MDQGHIQGDNMVEDYLHHKLTSDERTLFEAHLVDCELCRDRVLLAEMFHVRNGLARQPVPEPLQSTEPTVGVFSPDSYSAYWPPRMTRMPKRARFVAALEPWQIWLILTVAALLLVLIPTSYFVFGGR